MKIDVLCNDGSPLGITMKDLWGEGRRGIGVGGSEYALLTVLEGLVNRGHEVRLYNNPMEVNASPFEQLAIGMFNPNADRDILITFRSPNHHSIISKGLKVWWSCDQYTIGSFKDFAVHMDRIVCISPFHAEHFRKEYNIHGVDVIDIPIRTQDFIKVSGEVRVPGRCIFNSVPNRGLHLLNRMWPRIKLANPQASLVITSDYRLWGLPDPRNGEHRNGWLGIPDVQFIGAVPRQELLLQQARAQLLLYPCIYDELFCVAVAEAECMGVVPITSMTGALRTTNMGELISVDPSNVSMFGIQLGDTTTKYLKDESLWAMKSSEVMIKSLQRFNIDTVLDKWEEVFNN